MFCIYAFGTGTIEYMITTEEKVLKACQVLSEQDQLMLLIQIVEKWAEKKPRTSRLSLLQADAFRRLCLLEHAWQRLQYVTDETEKIAMQVEILLQRGWVAKAQSTLVALQTIAPKYARLHEFHERAKRGVQPPTQAQAQAILRRNDSQEMLQLASQCMRFGKMQVAQKILLHLLQQESKDKKVQIPNRYIQRLFWALQGDFTASMSLHQLLQQVEATDEFEEIETTVAQTGVEGLPGETSGNGMAGLFPTNLFRGEQETVTMEELTAEVTSAFVFSDRGQEPTQRVDSFMDDDRGTVAVDVIQEDENDMYEATGAFDKSMFAKESNDEEVVVLLSGDNLTSELTPAMVSGPVRKSVQVEIFQNVPEIDPALAEEKSKEETKKRVKTQNQKQKVLRGAIFAVLVLIVVVLLTLWGIRKVAAQNLIERSTPVLLSADAQEVGKLKTQLERQVAKGVMPTQLYTEMLGLSQYIYWRDFERDPELFEQAVSTLSRVPTIEQSWIGHMQQALMLLDGGHVKEAQVLLLPHADEKIVLLQWAQLELDLQSTGTAAWAPEIMNYPRVLVSAIQNDAMVPLLDSENTWVQLVSLRQELGHIDVETASQALESIQTKQWTLGSSQQGLMYLLQSLFQENQSSPKSRLLRKKAYESTSSNPEVRFWLGLDYFWMNEPKEALTLWQGCFLEMSACSSGVTFLEKEMAHEQQVLSQLTSLSDTDPMRVLLQEYVWEKENMLYGFWLDEPWEMVEIPDAFWNSLKEHHQRWRSGQTEPQSMWYVGWLAQVFHRMGREQRAFQSGLEAIQIHEQYPRMYAVLAESAEELNRDPVPFWTKYLSYDPQSSKLEKARKSIGG